MSRYIVARGAIDDLDEIWSYIAHRTGVDVAERFIELLTTQFPRLAANPGMGRQRPDLGEGMRSFSVRNYRIYYRQDARGQVRILHVRHTARDESKLLG